MDIKRTTIKAISAFSLAVLIAAIMIRFDAQNRPDGVPYTEPTTLVGNDATDPTPDSSEPTISDDLQKYAEAIKKAQTPTTLTLSLMSDTHYCEEEADGAEKLAIANKMATLSDYVQVDAIANLGDFVRGDEIKSETQTDFEKLFASTNKNAKCPVFYVRGNHDDNGWYSLAQDGNPGSYLPEEMLNDAQWYQMAFGFTAKDVVTDGNKPKGGYGYFDHAPSKIRIFLLNAVDIPYVLDDDGTYRYNSYQCYAFSDEQLNFVANALKFADKDHPNEWAALFLTHIPLDTTNDDGYRFGCKDAQVRGYLQMLGIISAYHKGISYTFSGNVNHPGFANELPEDFKVDIDVDYSEKGVGDVIGFVSGHTHTDNFSQKVGYENSLSYGYTNLSIIGSTSFATMVIDREKSIVTTFKYGEVRPQNAMEHSNPGAINGETELEIDMSTGVWVVPFEQFRPTGENLYNGLSERWGDGYFGNGKADLEPQTLELKTAETNEKWALSKAIRVKQATQYVIPDIGNSAIYYYRSDGTFGGSLSATDVDGRQIITTKSHESGGYLVFCFHKSTYPDYENFYIRELVSDN
jgi:hypothetical protein